jgi:hypothetical protein
MCTNYFLLNLVISQITNPTITTIIMNPVHTPASKMSPTNSQELNNKLLRITNKKAGKLFFSIIQAFEASMQKSYPPLMAIKYQHELVPAIC